MTDSCRIPRRFLSVHGTDESWKWPFTCGNDLVGARGFEPRTSSVSRNSRHAIYQHKRGLTCGDAFVVVRHVLVVALCFAGFPRDGLRPRHPWGPQLIPWCGSAEQPARMRIMRANAQAPPAHARRVVEPSALRRALFVRSQGRPRSGRRPSRRANVAESLPASDHLAWLLQASSSPLDDPLRANGSRVAGNRWRRKPRCPLARLARRLRSRTRRDAAPRRRAPLSGGMPERSGGGPSPRARRREPAAGSLPPGPRHGYVVAATSRGSPIRGTASR